MIASTFFPLAEAAAAAAQDAPPAPGVLMQLFPLIILAVLFYFLLIRPQQKRQKEHMKLIESIKTGDKIVTSAGIHGIIANVKDRTVIVKVADNVKIEFDKGSVAAVEKASDSAASS